MTDVITFSCARAGRRAAGEAGKRGCACSCPLPVSSVRVPVAEDGHVGPDDEFGHVERAVCGVVGADDLEDGGAFGDASRADSGLVGTRAAISSWISRTGEIALMRAMWRPRYGRPPGRGNARRRRGCSSCPARPRRFRGSALCRISQAASAETRSHAVLRTRAGSRAGSTSWPS